jgi:hypothetical protein
MVKKIFRILLSLLILYYLFSKRISFGIIGNLININIYLKYSLRYNSMGVYLTTVAAADIIMRELIFAEKYTMIKSFRESSHFINIFNVSTTVATLSITANAISFSWNFIIFNFSKHYLQA